MNNILILLAAGNSSRVNSKQKKQFIFVNDRPLLDYSLSTFIKAKLFEKIIIVINEKDINVKAIKFIKHNYKKLFDDKILYFVYGGKERFDSVFNALYFATDIIDKIKKYNIYIHDSARPFITKDDIIKISKYVDEYKAVSVATPITDTVKLINVNENRSKKNVIEVKSTINRNSLYSVQTPQAFDLELLIKAYKKFISQSKIKNVTDDLQLIELFTKYKPYLIVGNKNNIKITTNEDLIKLEDLK